MTEVVIDPGVHGGLVISTGRDLRRIAPYKSDEQVTALFDAVQGEARMTLELVGGYIGGEGNTGSSMFTFGDNTGFYRGFAAARGWELIRVAPFAWQHPLRLGTGTQMGKPAWKRALCAEAKRRFPALAGVTLATCDALLLWDFVTKPRPNRPGYRLPL